MTGALRLFACASAAVAAVGLALTPAAAKTKRELAAVQYRGAEQLLEDLRAVPAPELAAKQYNLVANAFRKVHRITPSSSYCDDALFHAAEVVAMMAARSKSDAEKEKAVSAYRFLIREYPHSKLLGQARQEIARLQAEPTAKAPASPSAPVEVTRAAEPSPTVSGPALTPVSTRTAPQVQPLPNRAQTSPKRTRRSLAKVVDLRHWSRPEGTRIVVELDDYVAYKFDFLARPRRLYFDLFTSQLGGALGSGANYEVGEGAVARIRVGQNRRTKTRLVLDLLDEVTYEVSWLTNPPRLVIELRGAVPPAKPLMQIAEARPTPAPVIAPPVAGRLAPTKSFEQALADISSEPAPKPVTAPESNPAPKAIPVVLAPPKPAAATSRGSQSLIRALGLKISRVVIDAGHGGHDTGMIGRGGLREKDVVLDISSRLGQMIEDQLGAEVILTRDGDRFLDLRERTRLANAKKADLFISIHANSSKTRSVRGVETYYLSLTADSWALKVASRENAAANHSVGELQDLLGKIALKDKIDESRELAGKMQTALHAGLAKQSKGLRNRGVRKAPFMVLIGAKMPAILAEIGFLSNPTDEKLFKTSKHRQYVAEQLLEGVRQYVDSLSSHQLTMKKDAEATRAQLDD